MVNKFLNLKAGGNSDRCGAGEARSAGVGALFINCKDNNFLVAEQPY